MEISANYIQITYTIGAGLIFCIAWAFSLKREVAVLTKVVEMNKINQDAVNHQVDKKFERIEEKLDYIIELIVTNGKK
jgi:hypothetical protein